MTAIVSQQYSIVTQLSLKLTHKQGSSKLPKPDERSFIPDLYLMIVNNYRIIIILNDTFNPANPIVIEQAKTQPKNQM